MDDSNATETSRNIGENTGWAVLSMFIVVLAAGFLMWIGVGLLSSAGAVVGGAFGPRGSSSLTDAQTFYVLFLYVAAFVSFAAGLKMLLAVTRRLLTARL